VRYFYSVFTLIYLVVGAYYQGSSQQSISIQDAVSQLPTQVTYLISEQCKDDRVSGDSTYDEARLRAQGYQVYHLNQYQRLVVSDSIISAMLTQRQQEKADLVLRDLSPGQAIVGQSSGQTRCVVEGVITDRLTDEPIIGATIRVLNTSVGQATDIDGRFAFTCECNPDLQVEVASLNYETLTQAVAVLGDGRLDLVLSPNSQQIEEVVISGNRDTDNVRSSITGLAQLSIKEIEKLPSMLGEPDILKSLLTLSGVTNTGEGSSGVNVRGGNVDQNLILIDDLMLFNPSHNFGFFSAMHPDLIKNVNLYKGNIPAEYGGRLSSVVQTTTRNGDDQRWKGKLGVGPIASKLYVEGPLIKGKTSLIVAGRISHINWLLSHVSNSSVSESSTDFYDVHGKISHRFSERLTAEGQYYLSNDAFSFANLLDLKYSTRNGNVKVNYLINDKLSVSTNAIAGSYSSTLVDVLTLEKINLNTDINYYKSKSELLYTLTSNILLKLGVDFIDYTVNPGDLTTNSGTPLQASPLHHTLEAGYSAQTDVDLGDWLSLSAGLRYADYKRLGYYREPIYTGLPTDRVIEGYIEYQGGEVAYRQGYLEPRIGLTGIITPSLSVKAGYNRTSQFMSQITNAVTPTPVDFWTTSSQYVLPSRSHLYSLGIYKNWNQSQIGSSVEVYYKDIDNITEPIDFANIVANPNIETDVVQGIGRSYGVEVNLDKKRGKWTGSGNYTYSRALRQVALPDQSLSINNGEWYSANSDKPHVINCNLKYEFSRRASFSAIFTYSSGRPYTAPVSVFDHFDISGILVYTDRNAVRMPDYHRLDVAYNWQPNIKKDKRYKTYWTIGVYNLYGRDNVYSVYYEQRSSVPKAQALTIVGVPIPSVSFNIEFL